MLDRLELLIGKECLERIKNLNILIIGIGGVGGYTLESLARSGVENITIVDYDKIDITNLNRQIISLNNNIGKYKVDEFKIRINNINPNCKVYILKKFLTKEDINTLINNYDYVIDACDTIEVKKEIIRVCLNKNIKFISCMGTGNKLDPTKLEIIDIRKTSYDPIAKKIRKMVKDEKLKEKINVICSKEKPIKTNSKIIGSTSYVPATAGLLCTSYIVNDIVGELYGNN